MRVLEAVNHHGCLYVLFMQGHMLCEGFRVKYGEQAGRAGRTVQRKRQLCNYTSGAGTNDRAASETVHILDRWHP